ncbi:CLIP domain-containing serine protease B4-like [Culicoides brevitarsis]|uniref:CLIP domain-containing serine protease B4-like n=1 Tax=Culicoides brevitarsis TaxID=469753 RepID=UPI00307B9E4D
MAKVLKISFNIFLISHCLNLIFGKPFISTLTKRNAINGDFPFMIYLTIQKTMGNTFMCGGSILTRNFGLTAAHCLTYQQDNKTHMAQSATAFMGLTDLTLDETHEVSRSITEMIIHENYQIFGDNDYTFNDIAVFRFNSSIDFCQFVQPITLPESDASYTNEFVTGMGWGVTEKSRVSEELFFDASRIKTHQDCVRDYRKIGFEVNENMICVEPSIACFGDSGGPLVLTNTSVIVGIVSFSSVEVFGSCNNNPLKADVYTRVSAYVNWIKKNVGRTEVWLPFGTKKDVKCLRQ